MKHFKFGRIIFFLLCDFCLITSVISQENSFCVNQIQLYSCNLPIANPSNDREDSINLCCLENFLDHPNFTKPEIKFFLKEIAFSKLEMANFSLTNAYVEKGLAIAKKLEDFELQLDLMNARVLSNFRLAKYYASLQEIDKAKKISAKHNLHEHHANFLIREGYVYWKIYNPKKAIELGNIAKEYLKKYDLSDKLRHDYHALVATSMRSLERYTRSRMHGDSAIYYANILDDDKLRGLALSNRSIQYHSHSSENMEYRNELMSKALAINKKMNDKQQLGSNYNAHSGNLWRSKKYKSSIEASYKSLEISSSIHDINEVYNAYFNLARCYEVLGDYENSLKYELLRSDLYKQLFGSEKLSHLLNSSIDLLKQNKNEELLKLENKASLELLLSNRSQNNLLSLLIFSLIFFGILYYLFIKYKLNSEIKKTKIKANLDARIAKLETNTLRSQMNPHFLFNSLNSIKSYIAKNEPRQATKYLNKFSQLIRQILEISKQEMVPLIEELKALRLYIELEQVRMSDGFDFTIELGENLDQNKIQVPPLIIQPFVENSIWHGLSHKKGQRKLEINLSEVENYLNISIRDNGIGREASSKLNAGKGKQHKSHGLKITQERLSLTKNISQESFKINIVDLKGADEKPVGTEVRFKIPKYSKNQIYETV